MRAWHLYFILGILAMGAYFLLPSQDAQTILRPVFNVAALGASVAGILLHRPKRPLPWYLVTAALLLFVFGIAAYVYYEVSLGKTPFPSLADLFLVASYPCAAAALLLFQRRRLVRDRASTIDPIIVAVGVGIVAWVFLMEPYASDQSLSLLQRLVSITYPLMDVLLLAFVVRMLLVSGRRPFAYYPLVAGLLCTLAFDVLYTKMTIAGTYETGGPIATLEILFLILIGTAALHPSMVDLSDRVVLDPETRLTRRRLALLAAASLTPLGILALQWARGQSIDVPVIVGGSVVLFLLVLFRIAGIMRTREEVIDRESLLRRTAAAFVAAPDREGIYRIAVDTAQTLLGNKSRCWIAIATGSLEAVTVVNATDDNADEVAGIRIYLDTLTEPVRTDLLEGRIVEVERLDITNRSKLESMGVNPNTQATFLVPLLAQAQFRGAIIVLTDAILSEGVQATLEALGREVALALESATLAAEVHRRESEERFRTLVQNSSDVVAIIEPDGVASYVSPVIERILGYKPEDGLGRNPLQTPVMHPDDAEKVRQVFAGLIGSPGAETTVDFRLRHIDGRWVHVEATSKNLLYDSNIGGIVVNFRDITERKTFEERLSHQAFHDHLTDLPNRALFMNRLGHALIRAKRRDSSVAVLFLDLDNFKLVNDSLGHEAGDKLLLSVAGRLRECLRAEDTAARFGGDEFTILLENITNASDAVWIANKITRVVSAPFILESREMFVTPSIGIALGTSGRERPTDLLRNADVALYRAKSSGKATYEVYDPLLDITALERLDLEADLRRGIERGEFTVHYQPQLNLSTGRIAGWEALVRWMHPERGLILPSGFLSVAEETGLIVKLGSIVLKEACRQLKAWQERHPAAAPLKMSVNISARQVQRPDELLEELIPILKKNKLSPGSLVLEITESMLMGNADYNVDVLRRFKELNVDVAVDDFGTGYSNLAYLKRFPVDLLKVDKSFVDGLGENPEDTAIVEAMINLAHAMGMQTVAEGIETTEQAARLRALGCEQGQGYYFYEPLPAHEADNLLSVSPRY